jgi:hypothetical protein
MKNHCKKEELRKIKKESNTYNTKYFIKSNTSSKIPGSPTG